MNLTLPFCPKSLSFWNGWILLKKAGVGGKNPEWQQNTSSRHLQESPGPGPKSQKENSKRLFVGVRREVPEDMPEKAKRKKKCIFRLWGNVRLFQLFSATFLWTPKTLAKRLFCDLRPGEPGDSGKWRLGLQHHVRARHGDTRCFLFSRHHVHSKFFLLFLLNLSGALSLPHSQYSRQQRRTTNEGQQRTPENNILWTDAGIDQNFQRDLGAFGPYEFHWKSIWANPLVPSFSGKIRAHQGPWKFIKKFTRDWHCSMDGSS